MSPIPTSTELESFLGAPKESARSPSLLVLGLGNDMMRDDGVGLRIAKGVRSRLSHIPDIAVVETGEMGLSLLDFITGHSALVLVDAVQTGKVSPGFLHEMCGDDLKVLPTVSPHVLGIGEILSLGRKLGMAMPERVRIFAVEVEDPFTLGTEMTKSLCAALPAILDRVTDSVLAMAQELTGGGITSNTD